MKKIRALLLVLVSFLAVVNGKAQIQNYILRTNAITDVSNTYGLMVIRQLGASDNYLVAGPASVLPSDLLNQVLADTRVLTFEADRPARHPEKRSTHTLNAASPSTSNTAAVKFYGYPVWTGYASQPAAQTIGATTAQFMNVTGSGVIVAVIDTGVDPSTPALQGVLLPGYDFTHNQSGASELADVDQSTAAILNQSTAAILNQSTAAILNQSTVTILNQSTSAILDQSTAAILNSNPLPSDFGHGTMVAGLIHLVAPQARIMPLKAFSSDGTANVSDIIRAIYYAVDNGAKVVNLSFSQDQISSEMLRAINYAERANVICVASTGNLGESSLVYPAAYGYPIGVASVSSAGALSSFSNYGPDITTVAAPGENLITTYPGAHWASVTGTSFSAALVSGAAAEIAGMFPHCDGNDVLDALASGRSYTSQLGWGVPNLFYAVNYAWRVGSTW